MAAIQAELAFPIRKSTRLRKKVLADDQDQSLSDVECQPSPRSRTLRTQRKLHVSLSDNAKSISLPNTPTKQRDTKACTEKRINADLDSAVCKENRTGQLSTPVKQKPGNTLSTPVKCRDTPRPETPVKPVDAEAILTPIKTLRTPCKANGESPRTPGRKLFNESVNFLDSPDKVAQPVSQITPSKAVKFSNKVNSPLVKRILLTPGKTYKVSDVSLSSPCKEVRIPLSPRKNVPQMCVNSPLQRTPKKNRHGENKQATPTKRHSDDENCPSPGSPSKRKKDTPRAVRSIFQDAANKPSPLRLAKQNVSCYSNAKKALAASLPEDIVGREKETQQIKLFLNKNLYKKTPASLYISGAPGTGKTAVLSHIMQELEENKKIKVVYINCMSFKNSYAIYNKVYSELSGKDRGLSVKDATKQLEKVLTSQGNMVVLIMDEVDQLDSKNQEVLYTMFEWPALAKSRVLLIGIANALDLTDRILPRLQARQNCRPQLLHFAPYTKDQIVHVLQHRLSKVEVSGHCVLEPTAVQFCARKVAAVAGDMRKALDVCRRAVETVEGDVKKQQVLAASADSPVVPKKITISTISKIVNEVYGARVTCSSSSGEQQTIPLQQKLAICTLLLMFKVGRAKEVTVGQLHEKYSKVCKKQHVASLDQSEFLSVCTLVESRGIMAVKRSKGKDARSAKVTLKMDEKELESALQDKTLLANILQNGLP